MSRASAPYLSGIAAAVLATGLGGISFASAERATVAAELPSDRSGTYRTLADYEREMDELASANPDVVRPLALPHTTYEGRTVRGIEITTDPRNIRDGKPVFLLMGLHHAREWSSGEHSIEWAHDLIQAYRRGDPELKPLIERTRTIVIPVVNPDGFNASRIAGTRNGHDAGTAQDNWAPNSEEGRRKNCRGTRLAAGPCSLEVPAHSDAGVDVNRNYGAYWGAGDASADDSDGSYRGPRPFSEPESRNVRDLVARRAVVTLISNHTYGAVVLRPPGVRALPKTPDERVYAALGAELAAENGYRSVTIPEFWTGGIGRPELEGRWGRGTTGTAEDWSYSVTGGLGYTIEFGGNSFHPPYETMAAQYTGETARARRANGGGNRGAFLAAMRSTASSATHSMLTGTATPGARLKLTRAVKMPTCKGHPACRRAFRRHDTSLPPGPRFLRERLNVRMTVPSSGRFELHTYASTSPIARSRRMFRRGNSRRWTLTCSRDGELLHTEKVRLRRGQAKELALAGSC